jgi:hypothetical protein
LELSKDGRRNYNLLEKLGEYLIDLAQNKVMKRGGIRDDNAHESGSIFSSVASSASKSVSR